MAEPTAEERALDVLLPIEDVTEDIPVDDPPPEVEEPEESTEDEVSSDDDAVEATEDAPEVVEIEVDGEILEVPVKYKDHFLRQADYTTKTQEVAAQRKEVEVQLGTIEQTRLKFEFAESIRDDVAKAEALESQANQAHAYLRDNIDTLTSIDIEKIRLAVDDSRRERDELVRSIQGKSTEFQQAQQQSMTELLNKGTEVLKQKIPDWGDVQQKQVREFALSAGFTEQEVSTVVDPRQVLTLYKAAQYDALKLGIMPAVKKVQNAPQIKPKSRNKMDQPAKDRLALNKIKKSNLNAVDKAAAIMDKIGDRFS